VVVVQPDKGFPAYGVLKVGDVIKSVDGQPVTSQAGLTKLIAAHPAGSTLTLDITRAGHNQQVQVGTKQSGGHPVMGVEITASGQVQPIGGIQQKMIGARNAGATIFLTPATNCADTKGAVPKGMRLVKVSTLNQAVTYLENLKAGKSAPSC